MVKDNSKLSIIFYNLFVGLFYSLFVGLTVLAVIFMVIGICTGDTRWNQTSVVIAFSDFILLIPVTIIFVTRVMP